jgi:3-hydroxyacyl-CoA dehydrogenase / enoyl-CoA hydratase / 3-hydroxybutyryl-CoA epimerase
MTSSRSTQLITTELSADGVLLATIDMPGRSMNVFSAALMDALEAIIEQVESSGSIKGVVITSGKSSFLAGADLPMVRGMTELARSATHAQMFAHCGRIGRLFLRIEQSDKPWVAAVNGTALGGGLELAMACRARVIDLDSKALIGLPEVKLGLLPGAGGTQRLPRLVGLQLGLDLLLSGRSLNPETAVQAGLFEARPANMSLLEAARMRLKFLQTEGLAGPEKKFTHLSLGCPPDSEPAVQALAAHHRISIDSLKRYPAYRAIIRSVLSGAGLAQAQACDVEMTRFLDLMFDPVADHMISTLFIERQRVEKALQANAGTLPRQIRTGAIHVDHREWEALWAKSGLALTADPHLAENLIELDLVDSPTVVRLVLYAMPIPTEAHSSGEGARPGSELIASESTSLRSAASLILSPRTEHGRVIECLLPLVDASSPPGLDAAIQSGVAALAKKLQCFVFFTRGLSGTATRSLLLELQQAAVKDSGPSATSDTGASQKPASPHPASLNTASLNAASSNLEAMALVAAQALQEGRVSDPGIIDVAAVLSGLSPAYTGGPISYAWSHRDAMTNAMRARLGASHASIDQKLQAYQASKKSA